MKSALLLFLLCLCVVSQPSRAESNAPQIVAETTLDIDGDGKMDRAALATNPGATASDLVIYLDAGDAKPDFSRPPSFVKRELAGNVVRGLSAKGNALIVSDSTGGASNDYETILTILYRGGAFIVAGYTLNWDTRQGAGSCDVNFITGKALVSHGVNGKPHPARGRFKPISLARWSDDSAPALCR